MNISVRAAYAGNAYALIASIRVQIHCVKAFMIPDLLRCLHVVGFESTLALAEICSPDRLDDFSEVSESNPTFSLNFVLISSRDTASRERRCN